MTLTKREKWEDNLSFKTKQLSKHIVSVAQIIVLNLVKLNQTDYFVKMRMSHAAEMCI